MEHEDRYVPELDLRPTRDRAEAVQQVRQGYGQHPCGSRACRKCSWSMLPPAYAGDFWDCTNPACGHSKAPSDADVRKMERPGINTRTQLGVTVLIPASELQRMWSNG